MKSPRFLKDEKAERSPWKRRAQRPPLRDKRFNIFGPKSEQAIEDAVQIVRVECPYTNRKSHD